MVAYFPSNSFQLTSFRAGASPPASPASSELSRWDCGAEGGGVSWARADGLPTNNEVAIKKEAAITRFKTSSIQGSMTLPLRKKSPLPRRGRRADQAHETL